MKANAGDRLVVQGERLGPTGGARSEAWIQELPLGVCLELLRASPVGRIAVVVDGAPVILPVSFRLVETVGLTWIGLRTRPGNVIDRADVNVAFEIDGVDEVRREGWSVLVRGTLHHVDPEAADFRERFDSAPWLAAERDSWLVIQPYSITGRQLHAGSPEWAFHVRAYL